MSRRAMVYASVKYGKVIQNRTNGKFWTGEQWSDNFGEAKVYSVVNEEDKTRNYIPVKRSIERTDTEPGEPTESKPKDVNVIL